MKKEITNVRQIFQGQIMNECHTTNLKLATDEWRMMDQWQMNKNKRTNYEIFSYNKWMTNKWTHDEH